MLTLFRMGHFGMLMDNGGKKVPFLKICRIYPTMMKLGTVMTYLKEIKKIYKPRDTPLAFC